MAQPKKFDAVTIIGIALALLLMFGGQWYLQKKNAAQQKAWEAQEAERKRIAAEQAAVIPPVAPAPPNGNGGPTPNPASVTPSATAAGDPEPADPGNIVVKSPRLEIHFTARGASIQDASFPDQWVDAGKKVKLGLEILAEIEANKRALALPSFDIGPREPESSRIVLDQPSGPRKSLDARVWKLASNSGAFDSEGNWKIEYGADIGGGAYSVKKTIIVNDKTLAVRMFLEVTNNSAVPIVYRYDLYGPPGVLLDGPPNDPKGASMMASIRAELAGRVATPAGEVARAPDEIAQLQPATVKAAVTPAERSISRQENLWGAVKNRFYMSALVVMDPTQIVRIESFFVQDPQHKDLRYIEPNVGIRAVRALSAEIAPKGTSDKEKDSFALYIGPAHEDILEQTEQDLKPKQPLYMSYSIQYCDIFNWRWPNVDWIAQKLMKLFQLIYSLFHNYGVAVVLLTLSIKAALHPLQRKMMISMNKLAKIQPEIKKLQEKYKGRDSVEDKRKLMMEQQDLMRKAGANPAAGCVPMLIQIPLFSALYGIFNHSFEMRGATFLWIHDLSQPDHLAGLPFWPHALNLLPILYIGVTFVQTKLSPQPQSDDPQQEMNRKMMMFMPVILSLMFYNMPAGLLLYFASSAVFGTIETWYIKKFLIKDGAPVVAAAPGSNRPPPAISK